MNKPFNKMNKTELVESIKALKLEDKVSTIAKDPSNPTNAEYVTVLEETGERIAPTKAPRATEAERLEFNNIAWPYIVTDHDTSINITDDSEGRVYEFRCGNSAIGMTTYRVKLNGEMQYLPRVAAKHLMSHTINTHINGANQKVKTKKTKRFKVTELSEGWSKEEFEALKKKQALQRVEAGQL